MSTIATPLLVGLIAACVLAASPAAADVAVAPDTATPGSLVVHNDRRYQPTTTPSGAADDSPAVLKQNWDALYACQATGTDPVICLVTLNGPTPASPGSVTPGRVEEAVRRIGLPALVTHVQPTTRTLVNVDTIVYATPAAFDDTVTLLGETVRIHAVPTTYTWHFGDGTTTTTTDPGAPWPHNTVTHRYQRVDDAVPVSVTVSYSVTYSTNAAPWVPLDSPIDSPGPSTIITVTEAHAVLVAP